MGNIPQQQKAGVSTFLVKGHLQLTIEGSEQPIDLGPIEIPLTLNIGGMAQQAAVQRTNLSEQRG